MGALEEALPAGNRTLADQAVDKLVTSLIQGSDSVDSLVFTEVAHIGSFLRRLKAKLFQEATNLSASSGLQMLLTRTLERETTVDLSHFVHLPITFLSSIIKALYQEGRMINLNLSNCNLEEDDLTRLLVGTCIVISSRPY